MAEFMGYPSKRQYVFARIREGKTPREIAQESGMTLKLVRTIMASETSAGSTLFPHITRAARKRGLSVPEMRTRLLRIIDKDNLVEAILDDGEGA